MWHVKTIGLFDAKTRFSEICAEVAETHEPVTITRRGAPLVMIQPVAAAAMTIRERRQRYLAGPGKGERSDSLDFEPAPRSREVFNNDPIEQ